MSATCAKRAAGPCVIVVDHAGLADPDAAAEALAQLFALRDDVRVLGGLPRRDGGVDLACQVSEYDAEIFKTRALSMGRAGVRRFERSEHARRNADALHALLALSAPPSPLSSRV